MLDDAKMEVLELAGQGYTCAQIVVLMGLRVMGRENPDLIRAMSGLAMGAACGSLCGALTGGLCLVGLHTGQGRPFERPVPGGRIPLGALVKWFVAEELGGRVEPTCRAIFESAGQSYDFESANPAAACGDLVSHVWAKALALVAEHGLDPSAGRVDDE
ncbi:MAG: C-GCAxxG-C-C family protein [Deltaproteobacteria bacterium]|jgi:hypothetical protein|nr:C-GCAxxG-C-C family protein [Deltaproteobacteria bacterium]